MVLDLSKFGIAFKKNIKQKDIIIFHWKQALQDATGFSVSSHKITGNMFVYLEIVNVGIGDLGQLAVKLDEVTLRSLREAALDSTSAAAAPAAVAAMSTQAPGAGGGTSVQVAASSGAKRDHSEISDSDISNTQ